MALTHHYIVQLAAYRCGHKKFFSDYILLGDDIMIADTNVYRQYQAILKHYDMPYAVHKTHNSKYGFEFAKRWFMHGEEVTGFAVGGLYAVRNNYSLLHNFLSTQSDHGWTLSLEQALDLITHMYRRMRYSPRRSSALCRLYSVFHYVQLLKGTFLDPMVGTLNRGAYPKLFQAMEGLGVQTHELVSYYTDLGCAFQGRDPLQTIAEMLYSEARAFIVESDLARYQNQTAAVNRKLTGWLKLDSVGAEVSQLGCLLQA